MFRQTYISQRRLRGINVIYSRGAESVQIEVIAGRTPTTIEDSETRIQIKAFVRDYLILPEDLILNDEQIYPRAGDLITEENGAEYEVMAIQSGEPAWVWHDMRKEVLRVHSHLTVGT